ncbi:MAG: family lipase [Bacilli bacterium]|nr:family lipase [Bacilli bacterium]
MGLLPFLQRLVEKNNNYGEQPTPMIVFLGDSITQGVFEVKEGLGGRFDIVVDPEAVYHAKLKRKLQTLFPNAPITIHNAGISGDNAQGGLARLERDVLRYQPDLTVVCFGLNDSGRREAGMDDYENGLRGIFRKLKAADVQTVFLTPNMKNTYVSPMIPYQALQDVAVNCADQQNHGVMDAYMDLARQVCREEGVPVCDVYRKWKQLYEAGVDITVLLSNHINHPNRDLHSLFADSLFDLIVFE